MKRKYMADMQRDLHQVEARLNSSYHFIYRRLRRASRETWPRVPEYMLKPGTTQGPVRYKVRLSDEIRALCGEICEDLTRGDRDLYWEPARSESNAS